jgi:hypothetical protein
LRLVRSHRPVDKRAAHNGVAIARQQRQRSAWLRELAEAHAETNAMLKAALEQSHEDAAATVKASRVRRERRSQRSRLGGSA